MHWLGVVDGASSKTKIPFVYEDGLPGGAYLAEFVKRTLEDLDPDSNAHPSSLYGANLISYLTEGCRHQFQLFGIDRWLAESPEYRPSASLVLATLIGDQLAITQVGDVAFRVNGRKWYGNPRAIDTLHQEQRRDAISAALKENPDIPLAELLRLGRKAIESSLLRQVKEYQNNPNPPFGHGVLDGQDVPEQFVRAFLFPRVYVHTLEIVSDGYFDIAPKPTIGSWEEVFARVEQEDPYKFKKHLSTKGSDPDQGLSTDDRTVLITRFHS